MAVKKMLVIALFASLAIIGLTEANNLTLGTRTWGDRLIQIAHVKKSSKFLRIAEYDQTFPGDGHSTITFIHLIDNNKKGNGAFPSVVHGGTGSSFVTVSWKSQRGHSIDFNVEIYGK